jgi:hypothetical protein
MIIFVINFLLYFVLLSVFLRGAEYALLRQRALGEIFEKLLTLKFFLMGNNTKIFLDENILLYVNDLICSLGESITLLHFLYFFHH